MQELARSARNLNHRLAGIEDRLFSIQAQVTDASGANSTLKRRLSKAEDSLEEVITLLCDCYVNVALGSM